VEAALDAFLDALAHEQGYSHNTIVAYGNDLNQFVSFLRQKGIAQWRAIGPAHIRAYTRALVARQYAASTVARKVAALKSFFHYLHGRELVPTDAAVGIGSPPVKKRLPRSLTADQVDRLLSAPSADATPKTLRDRALLALLLATGMRVSEVITLAMNQVDLVSGTVMCPSQEGGLRALTLDQHARNTLADYLEAGRPRLLRDPDELVVFLNHRGHPLTRQGLWLIIKSHARAAGLSFPVTPHTLRHSFAAHQVAQGTDLRQVQSMLGHANISTTNIYAKVAAQIGQNPE
jgi:integrase/recombinase XerD